MRTASERAKVRRNFRLEFLEDRNLLSSIFSPQGLAGEVSTPKPIYSITGHVQGLPATAGLYTATLPGKHSYSGHGSARPVGNVLFSAQQVETTSGTALTITGGSAQMYDYKGNELFITYTGTGTNPKHGPATVSLTGTVTGGTRRFLHETGTFFASGTLVHATGRLNLGFTVVFNQPA